VDAHLPLVEAEAGGELDEVDVVHCVGPQMSTPPAPSGTASPASVPSGAGSCGAVS
jgi:hypothetical protein